MPFSQLVVLLDAAGAQPPLFAYFDVRDLTHLSRVNRHFHQAVTAYIKDTFAIKPRLTVFFPDPVAFRTLQARTGTLISGDFALSYFDREPTPSNLDLYVHPHQRREVGRWLIQHAGYTFRPMEDQDPDFEGAVIFTLRMRSLGEIPGLAAAFTFHKPGTNGQILTIQVIVGKRGPMEMILSSLSSELPAAPTFAIALTTPLTLACEMNIISFEKAYSLFPAASVEQCCSTRNNPLPCSMKVDPERMGGNVCVRVRHPSGALGGIPSGLHWLGDAHTWVIPLGIHGITPHPPLTPYSSPLMTDPAAITSFYVRYNHADGLSISFFVLHSDALRYCYVVGARCLIDHLRLVTNSLAWNSYYNSVCRLDDWL